MSGTAIDRILLMAIIEIARTAAARILQVYDSDFTVTRKEDHSPLTEADLAAHQTILRGLSQLSPKLPVLSEESTPIPFAERRRWHRYWLVDPLDGTREFIKRNDEFTVNIALIEDHRPILGVILAPVTGVCYFAARGFGAHKWQPNHSPKRIRVRRRPTGRLTVAGSRSHRNALTETFICNLGDIELLVVGSSLKSCLVAEGRADIYPRFGATSEWDTAAAQCVVEEAGGGLANTALVPLRYNTEASLTNPPFLAFGDISEDWRKYLP